MSEKNTRISNLFAISLLALAGSISYFTYQLSLISDQIPDILENIRLTSEKIEPALNEIGEIRALIEPIVIEINTINKHIPAILNESEQIRANIFPILNESKLIRSSISPILNESAAIRKQLPAVLSSVNDASTSITLISYELKAYQPIATDALVQIEGTRKEIPQILDRTDAMIDLARVAAREASSGVVTGAIGGLLTAPFRLVGSLGSNLLDLKKSDIKYFTEDDLNNLHRITYDLLDNGQLGDSKTLTNPETKLRVNISIQKEFKAEDETCRQLLIKSWIDSELKLEKTNIACENSDGSWMDKES